MRLKISLLVCSAILLIECTRAQNKILIITGGHSFEEPAFYEMFDSFSSLEYDTVTQPHGNEMINSSAINQYDALVFYDMYQDITEEQKAAYLELLNRGKGMVFLHHSLVSYQDWPEFREIIGGKYLLENEGSNPKSTYKHDEEIHVKIADKSHDITRDLQDFTIFDEVYGSYLVNTGVHTLLTTEHPESTKEIGWYHPYKNSRIVYLQFGHDHHGYENVHFRKLVRNAIDWVIRGD